MDKNSEFLRQDLTFPKVTYLMAGDCYSNALFSPVTNQLILEQNSEAEVIQGKS
jgi:hypothetical protein